MSHNDTVWHAKGACAQVIRVFEAAESMRPGKHAPNKSSETVEAVLKEGTASGFIAGAKSVKQDLKVGGRVHGGILAADDSDRKIFFISWHDMD